MLCQAVGTGQLPQQQPRCPQNGHGRGQKRSENNGSGNGGGNGNGGGGGYNNGGGGYSGGGGSGNANSGGRGNGSNYGNGGGNRGNQIPSGPSSVKRYKNWNYCFAHGGNVSNNHTSMTCAHPSKNHQRAATRINTMGCNLHYMNKTVFPSAVGRHLAPTLPPPLPLNYVLGSSATLPVSTHVLIGRVAGLPSKSNTCWTWVSPSSMFLPRLLA